MEMRKRHDVISWNGGARRYRQIFLISHSDKLRGIQAGNEQCQSNRNGRVAVDVAAPCGSTKPKGRTCFACSGHAMDHETYDPRCPFCIVERVRAMVQAAAILLRLALPPYD